MTDIVERLRDRIWRNDLQDEAADEIERLRAGLEYMRTLADDIETAARVALRGQRKE